MLDQTVVIYCICDELIRFLNIKDDPQCKMSTAEIITFAIMSAILYGSDYKKTRLVASHHKYFKNILSNSQIVRRIHSIDDDVWLMVFNALQVLLKNKECTNFIVDSFPIKAFENHKSFRARIFSDKKFHGFCASKNQYFFGIKVHMVIDTDGVPVELSFSPGSNSDIKSLEDFSLNLPDNSMLLGDRAYTSYKFEDNLLFFDNIKLLAKRRKNLKRQHSYSDEYLLSSKRNYIETVFSSIVRRLPRYIRARTEKGFCLKVFFTILAYMVQKFFPLA